MSNPNELPEDDRLRIDYLSLPSDTPRAYADFLLRTYRGRTCQDDGPASIVWGVIYNQASKGVEHDLKLFRFLQRRYSNHGYTAELYLYLLTRCSGSSNSDDTTLDVFLEEFVSRSDHMQYLPRILEKHSPDQIELLHQLLLRGYSHVLRRQSNRSHMSRALAKWITENLGSHQAKILLCRLVRSSDDD